MKKYVVVEFFEIFEKTIVEANSKEEAEAKVLNDDEHNGDVIDCYEVEE